MAAVITELFDSGNGSVGANASRQLHYSVTGTELTLEAQALVEATAPLTLAGLFFDSYDIAHLGGGVWEATVKYAPLPRRDPAGAPGGSGGTLPSNTSPRLSQAEREPAVGEFTEAFDTTGGTRKVMQSQVTDRYARDGEVAPDFEGAIGVNGDNVDGCEVTTPVFNFTETWHLPATTINPAYKKVLYLLTGKVNLLPFRGFDSGEVLFMGVSGSGKWRPGAGAGVEWELTFKFAAQPNAVVDVGAITGVDKLGWEYLWVRYESAHDAAANHLVTRPKAVYVEQVYGYGDFAQLGIGT